MELPFDARLDVTLVKGDHRMRYRIVESDPDTWMMTVEQGAPAALTSTDILTTPESVVASWEALHREIDLAVTFGGWSSLSADDGIHVRSGRARTAADA